MRILVVDDEGDICEILAFNLVSEGFEVDVEHSAEGALERLGGGADYGLILLDVMMGGMSGYRMVERLRREGNRTPVIFLTARDTENDMLTGFSVGADDYIAKPFSLKEVSARVKAVLRRAVSDQEAERLEVGDLAMDFRAKEVTVGGMEVALTKTEFEILALLAGNPSRIFSREEIIERVWKDAPYVTERTVDVHITRLRKKLGVHGASISSRAGYGYRFNAE